jgi:hypothetical protein
VVGAEVFVGKGKKAKTLLFEQKRFFFIFRYFFSRFLFLTDGLLFTRGDGRNAVGPRTRIHR